MFENIENHGNSWSLDIEDVASYNGKTDNSLSFVCPTGPDGWGDGVYKVTRDNRERVVYEAI